MMRMISQKIQENTTHADYKVILQKGSRFFFISSGVLFLAYLYCVGAVTFTVLHRRSLEQDLKLMTSDISHQELSFLDAQKSLTKEYAYAHGFVDPSSIAFSSVKRAVALNAGH